MCLTPVIKDLHNSGLDAEIANENAERETRAAWDGEFNARLSLGSASLFCLKLSGLLD